jgi:potassium channel subfamily K, other eukaryote
MNDPGLDEPINSASEQVKEQNPLEDDDNSDMDEEEEEQNFLLPAKWWYASTVFPLSAGTFGPMANAFSICALVENWRVSIPPGGTEEHGIDITDPRWLVAVNAVSLVFALIANMSLLLNMARRLRFEIAQPITIIGFWVASVMLIVLVAIAAHDFHAPGVKHQALTQAYYYAIFAAGIYQIISYLMCVTVWGAYHGHYSKEFKLTLSQRTLMLQTISFLVYLLLGALVYSNIEGWEFEDAIYWADFTLLTIGIGDDYTPETHLGRGLLFPFALGGIVILGLLVGSIRSLLLDRTKKKLSARMTEKIRRRVLQRVEDAQKKTKNGKFAKVMGLNKEMAKILTQAPSDDNATEVQRRKVEFEAMRTVQEMAAEERKWISLAISTFAFFFLWTIGALVFWQSEKNQKWSYFEAFYFSYTTLLTIGYGDFQPISNSGKPFFVFWSLLAIPTLTILISNMGDTVVKVIKDLTIWLGEISVLPSDQGRIVDRLKYGAAKATNGSLVSKMIMEQNTTDEREELDEDFRNFQEANPGLVKMPARDKHHGHGHRRKFNIETAERLGKDMEEEEKMEEDDAKLRSDWVAEDDHHYRHILISQIRKVYRDTNSSTPKKYSYGEWAFYLALLGEDENDSKFHRKAPIKPHDKKAKEILPDKSRDAAGEKEKEEYEAPSPTEQQDGKDDSSVPGVQKNEEKSAGVVKWSWIGNRSPLMGDQSEPEWLLEKLFVKLEESLRQQWKAGKEGREEKNAARGDYGGKDERRDDETDDKELEQTLRARSSEEDSDGTLGGKGVDGPTPTSDMEKK